MTLLIAGLVLFAGAHLYPSAFKANRDSLAAKLGQNGYRGTFSVIVFVSLLMIVFGWRSATPSYLYSPPFTGGILTSVVIFVAFVLFVGSQTRTNIKRYIRHPQMLAVVLWSLAHLLVNGDSRSTLLFGGLGAWAILEIIFCNRRDGARRKPDPSPIAWDFATVVIAAIAFALLLLAHETLFNVAPYLG